ncbi:fatty acid hydroxylase (macronuclear) [Tetrahymena thermophila SB210]|uniref:Fatty acid hydroxylase n=1 Tax=Tetrahymena thermophila (strain SB210) TaxID=312017 RepID=Q232H4_TETTS|nr:fatty acid hydroxylase [Tetrahymena thermophila SB210]EAR91438.2 fatty acid hydroxylase [Tetrahymena thermophila SB210]|eukprot:XP_001011683.2 fatty acid hydroxylase [Tetrahymena thermophila SB210]
MSNKIKPLEKSTSNESSNGLIQNRKLKRFLNPQKVEEFAEENDKMLVIFQNKVYDLSQFQHEHPGGQDAIEDYQGLDISDIFFNSSRHKHSQYAQNLMQKYIYGVIGDEQEEEREQLKQGKIKKQYPHLTHDYKLEYKNVTLNLNKGLVSQIRAIKDKKTYEDLLKNPCKRVVGTKLFDNDSIDSLLNNNIGIVVLLYTMIFIYMFYCGLNLDYNYSRGMFDRHYKADNRPLLFLFGFLFCGIIIFWIMEYVFLRIILQPYVLGKTFHFLIFGIHYVFPLDEARTTIQPFFSIFVAFLIRYSLGLLIYGNTLYLILSGICLGYLYYEVVHYALHNKKKLTLSYSQYLRNKHAKHHFKDREYGYQVTNHFWDKFFQLNDLDEEEKTKDIFGFITGKEKSTDYDSDS